MIYLTPAQVLFIHARLIAETGALLQAGAGYVDGQFVFLYAKDNQDCAHAVDAYRECLTDDTTFAAWTLESVVEELHRHSDAGWIHLFRERYLAFDRVDERLTIAC